MLQDYNDYISNPKSPKWNSPEYPCEVQYRWTHKETGKTGIRTVRVKELQHIHEIVAYWNAQNGNWDYEVVNRPDIKPFYAIQKLIQHAKETNVSYWHEIAQQAEDELKHLE